MSDGLDKTLREWAERQAPGEAHLRSLSDEIRMKAVSVGQARTHAALAQGIFAKLGYAVAGAAVALAVVAVVLQQGEDGTPAAASPTALAGFSSNDVAKGKRVFDEFERLFADRLRWIAQSNGNVAMGVESLYGSAGEEGAPAAVRLVMVARRVGASAWRPVFCDDPNFLVISFSVLRPVSKARACECILHAVVRLQI